MQTKLTLRLEQELIEKAKRYAETHGTSVSQIVADYFRALTALHDADQAHEDSPRNLLPITSRLTSRPAAGQVDEAEYRRFLERKYLESERTADPHPSDRT